MKKSIRWACFCVVLSSQSVARAQPHVNLAVIETEHTAQLSFTGIEFSEYFTNEANYNRVYWNVMSWFGSTKNGCVAFASTALRFMGMNIGIDALYNGERVSLLTRPFSSFLENKMGWIRIRDSKALQPGDLVFTVDEPTAPGYPAHVFMHSGYADAAKKVSLAVDNQDFTHERALAGDVKKDYSAFAYALRVPGG